MGYYFSDTMAESLNENASDIIDEFKKYFDEEKISDMYLDFDKNNAYQYKICILTQKDDTIEIPVGDFKWPSDEDDYNDCATWWFVEEKDTRALLKPYMSQKGLGLVEEYLNELGHE
ncbi:hypothetical protein ELUMI_v1c04820 [Williamsoniiplasma luminosum]|uniref:50S ribosomal protein L5 n=1 Tax=Williamsoniiplasma luminosum TaxID=214888 RepID=A0A2K8NUJ1_9MOLU|nr:hypothetical protein [Williamsoniiplasma luminosum]ATZ17206.1 hypothetical protein ELUMI_v1c04820 [Williamsoniiplasma luminosum]